MARDSILPTFIFFILASPFCSLCVIMFHTMFHTCFIPRDGLTCTYLAVSLCDRAQALENLMKTFGFHVWLRKPNENTLDVNDSNQVKGETENKELEEAPTK